MRSTPRPWLVPILITFAVVILYSFSLHGPFIYDDVNQIVQNTKLHDFLNLRDVVFSGLRQIRVLLNLSFAVDWAISGPETWSFHVTNVGLHLANCALLFLYLRRVMPTRGFVIGLTTTLFALHPLQVGSVAYVMGRISLLQATFFLGCLNLTASPDERKRRWALPLAAFSLLAKESCALIPLLLLWHDLTFGGKMLRTLGAKKIWASVCVMLLIIPLQWLFRDPSSMYDGTTGFDLFPYIPYLITQGYYSLFHLWLLFSAADQSLFHAHPLFDDRIRWIGSIGILYVIGLAVALFAYRSKRPYVSFFLGLYFITLAPTNSVLQMINPFAEYRLYQANIALFVFLALGLEFVLIRFRVEKLGLPISLGLLVVFSAFNYGQQLLWADAKALISYSIELYPESHQLHTLMAQYYNEQRNWPEFEKSLRASESFALVSPYQKTFRPTFMLAYFYAQNGRYDEALGRLDVISERAGETKLPFGFYELRLKLLKTLRKHAEFDQFLEKAAAVYPRDRLPSWE